MVYARVTSLMLILSAVVLTCSCVSADPSCRDTDSECQLLIQTQGLHNWCYNAKISAMCCDSCKKVAQAIPGCQYGDQEDWCATLDYPRDCYLYRNNRTCCQSCKQHKTNVPGCEYGDKRAFCASMCPRQCYWYDDACCHSCKQYDTNVTAADCTTGQGCRAATSCLTGGTVYCCASGGRLVANGTAHTCTCEAGSGLECSGGTSVGVGAQFLPAKPADDGSSSSNLASGLTCVMAPILVVCFRFFSQLRG